MGILFASFANNQVFSSIVVARALLHTLKVLIEQHHEQFRECYLDTSITPKMHTLCGSLSKAILE